MAVIELIGISKTYYTEASSVQALQSLDLVFEAGRFTAIMGASGSGKSTLLNLLGCMDRPSAGAYILDGHDVSSLDDDALSEIRCHKIGMVFQSFNLFPHYDVLENICVPLRYAEMEEEPMQERARQLLELVGLSDRIHHRPTELSGGQCQRVAIARALANEPAVVLADEPTGNLDEKTGREVLAIFQHLRDQGRTIIMVTHNPEYGKVVERVIRLQDGRVTEDSQPAG